MQSPLLSICIATYNDPQGAERALKSIVPQATPEVEILVRDDSPGSETEKIVEKYSKSFPIRYIKGEKIGLDRVIIFVTKEAKGKYVWWFGNDVVVEGAVHHVLQLLKRHPDLSFVWAHFRIVGENSLESGLEKDKFFKDKNQVIEEIRNRLGFISSTILRRDLALSGVASAEKYIGTAFVNFYLVMHVLSQGDKFYFISGPSVTCYPTPPEEHFYDGFSTFAIHFFDIAMSFKDSFDNRALKKMLAKNFGHVWRGILVNWLRGSDTPRGKFWKIMRKYWSFPEIWIAGPLFLLPRFVTRFLYFVYKKVLGRSYGR